MAPKVVTSNYKKVKKNKKVDGNISPIPKFSYKSAVIIVLSAALSCFFLPNMIAGFGVDTRITTLIGNAVIISFAVCYCRYFIETDKGFHKNFITVYFCFFYSNRNYQLFLVVYWALYVNERGLSS